METSMDQSKAVLHLHLLKCEMAGLKDFLGKFISQIQLRLELFSTLKYDLVSKSILSSEQINIFDEFFSFMNKEIQLVSSKMCGVEEETENFSKVFYSGYTTDDNTLDGNETVVLENDIEEENFLKSDRVKSEDCHEELSSDDDNDEPKLVEISLPDYIENLNSENSNIENFQTQINLSTRKDKKVRQVKGSKTQDKIFSCNLCPKTLKTAANLKRHLKFIHKNDEMETTSSTKEIECQNDVMIPSNWASGNEASENLDSVKIQTFKCENCDQTFTSKGSLKRHCTQMHSTSRLTSITKPICGKRICHVCGKTMDKTVFKNHMATHSGEKPYRCSVCNKGFSSPNGRKTHMVQHTSERPYQCATCGSTFKCNSNLRMHMKIHTGIKHFKCDQCPSSFYERSKLKMHMRIHTNERAFKCHYCPAAFNLNYGLVLHIRTHTGEKPFECDVCQKRFSKKSSLTTHKGIHKGLKFPCTECGNIYSGKKALVAHKKNVRNSCGKKP